jgi:hypothetical protein
VESANPASTHGGIAQHRSAAIITADCVGTPQLSAAHGGAARQAVPIIDLNAVTLTCITKSFEPSCCDGSVLQHCTFYLGRFWAGTNIGFHVRDLPLHCVFLIHILAAGVL